MGVLDQFSLSGKTALVTGANRGLGQAIAIGLAEAGANVAGLNRSNDDGGTGTQIQATGCQYMHIALDLGEASTAQLAKAIEQVVAEFGTLDILVNNAGIIRRAPAMAYSADDWHAVLQVNLNALFFLSQAAANHMSENGGGKIINVASLLSYEGGILVPAYTAAKHGVMGVTRALANEWAAHNINVNAIAPGYMATDNTAPLRADETRNAAILARIPVGEWGQPEQLQGAAVFLASDASRYMHGATIAVDGGWLAR